jgi:TetR/AcrR family transcriptional regulator, transcriptional repressor for nem operon
MHIIEKAAPLFNAKGYAATSMSDILKATGLAKGGIYGNFGSKDEIAVEAFDYSYQKVMEAIRFKTRQHTTASAKLTAIYQFYRNYTINPEVDGGCPILNTAVDADDNLPFLKRRAAAALQEVLSALEGIISSGISSGEFQPTLNAKKEAIFIFGLIEGGIMMSKLTDSPIMLNSLLDNLKDHLTTRYLK